MVLGQPGTLAPERVETSLTVDVALLTIRDGRLSVLLVKRTTDPYAGCWALPGAFVHQDESLEEAARRDVCEKTGLQRFPETSHLEQLKTYGDPTRDPRGRVVSVAYLGLMPDLTVPPEALEGSRFWPVEDLGTSEAPSLAFDHERIVADAVERARAKLEYAPVATAFVAEPFTLADLRRIYEAVWGVSLDASNFRRKVLSTEGFVTPLGETAPPPGGGRPAELYRRGRATLLHPAMLRPS